MASRWVLTQPLPVVTPNGIIYLGADPTPGEDADRLRIAKLDAPVAKGLEVIYDEKRHLMVFSGAHRGPHVLDTYTRLFDKLFLHQTFTTICHYTRHEYETMAPMMRTFHEALYKITVRPRTIVNYRGLLVAISRKKGRARIAILSAPKMEPNRNAIIYASPDLMEPDGWPQIYYNPGEHPSKAYYDERKLMLSERALLKRYSNFRLVETAPWAETMVPIRGSASPTRRSNPYDPWQHTSFCKEDAPLLIERGFVV